MTAAPRKTLPPSCIPPTLRVTGGVGGFILVDPRVHPSAYYGAVATVTQRDPVSVHGGGIDIEEAHRRAQLFAAAEGLATAARALLILIDTHFDGEPFLQHEVEVLRAVLALAQPDGQPIMQREGVPA